MTQIAPLFARQPIYDHQLNVHAYELLFRPTENFIGGEFDGDSATSQVVLNAFTSVNFDTLNNHLPAFVNFTRNWLRETPPFNPSQVVIEVLENIEVDDEVIEDIKQLKKKGFTIALDDFIYSDSWLPLVEIADIIKIDVLSTSKEEVRSMLTILQKYPTKLLAEKVENHQMLTLCQSQKFDYFQGYFLSKPQIIKGTKLESNQMIIMNILSKLQNPEIEINTLDSLISQDPILSFRILRLINSAAYNTGKEVTSIHKAINMLGLKQIKQWASIIALTKLSNKPETLFIEALYRAKMCEYLAIHGKIKDPNMYFTVGLFSMLDAFLDQEMKTVLNHLPLAKQVNDAILTHKGLPGKILLLVIAHQRAQWHKVPWGALEKRFDITDEVLSEAQLEALLWSQDVFSAAH